MDSNSLFVGLDIGTTKIVAMIGSGSEAPSVRVPLQSVPPPTPKSNPARRSAQGSTCLGFTPLSKRKLESLESLCRLLISRTITGSKVADSISTFFVSPSFCF